MIATWKREGIALAVLVLSFFLTGCGGAKHVERGTACWYGGKEYQGKPTASGETFNQNALTAAHNTFPFDTVVRVKNLRNGRDVKVRINDRGPFVRGRIIDLSRAAAREIDMIGAGTDPVRIEVIRWGRRR